MRSFLFKVMERCCGGNKETEINDLRGRKLGLLGRDTIPLFSHMIQETICVFIRKRIKQLQRRISSTYWRRVLGWRSSFARSDAHACPKKWGLSQKSLGKDSPGKLLGLMDG